MFHVAEEDAMPRILLTRRSFVPIKSPLKVITLGNYVLMEKGK